MPADIQYFPLHFSASELAQAFASLPGAPGWIGGRQGTGYRKLDVKALSLGLPELRAEALALLAPPHPDFYDEWILLYEPGDFILPHRDPPLAEGLAHWRLNVLVEAGAGGELTLNGASKAFIPGDAVLFRPDVVEHAVSEILSGHRLVWSLGTNRPA